MLNFDVIRVNTIRQQYQSAKLTFHPSCMATYELLSQVKAYLIVGN